jgi:hypothetical protein
MSGRDKLAMIPIFSPAAKPSDTLRHGARGGIGRGALVGARRRRRVGALCFAHPTTLTGWRIGHSKFATGAPLASRNLNIVRATLVVARLGQAMPATA